MFSNNIISTDEGPRPDFLERHKAMRSEIDILDKLIRDKYQKLSQMKQEQTNTEPKDSEEEDSNSPGPSYQRKLSALLRQMDDIERLTTEDDLTENDVEEYIEELSRKYDHVLIFPPQEVQKLQQASNETLLNFLNSKLAAKYKKILFVLNEGGHYSLLMFNSPDASFYHFDTTPKQHSDLVEQIALKLRRYFEADQLVDVTCESNNVESSWLTIDNVMKVVTVAGMGNDGDLSSLQILNLSSQSDCFHIIVMNWCFLNKLDRVINLGYD